MPLFEITKTGPNAKRQASKDDMLFQKIFLVHDGEHTFLKEQSTETRSVRGASYWKLCGGLGVDEINLRVGYTCGWDIERFIRI